MAEEKKDVVKEIKKEESKAIKELRKNPWIAATFVFAILALILLYFVLKGGASVSSTTIGVKAVDFINTQLLQGQGTVTLDSVSEKAGLYEVSVNYNSQKIPVYFTKDGSYYVGTMIVPLDSTSGTDTNTTTPTPKEILKSDKPKVELFVMTHCPYGTQAEKGIIPAINALGNSIDAKIRFVHYTMHGEKEVEETNRQLCIRETVPGKFYDYLTCFLEDGNSTRCLKKYSLNVDSCVAGKAKDYYSSDSALSEGYGVQGSPTLIINGAEADFYPRSPDSALKIICAAFNTPPAACSQTLSTENPAAGFGGTATSASTSDSAASCG